MKKQMSVNIAKKILLILSVFIFVISMPMVCFAQETSFALSPQSNSSNTASTTKLANGIYKIKNAANNLYIDSYNAYEKGINVTQCEGPQTGENINQLFKITYLKTEGTNDYYIIRSMVNSQLSFAPSYDSSTNVTWLKSSEVKPQDDFNTQQNENIWVLWKVDSRYKILNLATTGYITAPSNSNSGEFLYTEPSSNNNYQFWYINQVTGITIDDTVVTSAPARGLVPGESFNFHAYMRSTSIGVNGPVRYTVINPDGTPTSKASIDSSSGTFVAIEPGSVKVKVDFLGSSNPSYVNVSIESSFFIKNRYNGKYLQIDNDVASNTDGAIMELWSYDVDDDQIWVINYVEEGYYNIISKASGKALMVNYDAQAISGEYIRQGIYYPNNTNQQWKIELTSHGSFKITNRATLEANKQFVMCMGETLLPNSNGVNVKNLAYTDDTNYKDEWILEPTIKKSIGK